METDIKAIAINFIKTLQNRTSAEELLRFYHPDIEQIEFPNAVPKNKAIRNLNDLKAGAEKGKKVLQKEEYEVVKSYSFENTVIIEAIWTGTLAIPLATFLSAGR